MKRPPLNPWLCLAFAGGILYPLFVYFGIAHVPATIIIIFGLALIVLRLVGLRQKTGTTAWIIASLIAAALLIFLSLRDGPLALKAYPIVMSLSVSVVFTFSLFYPPTIIERIARLTEPNLPPEGVFYTRQLTVLWALFLFLWNGLISYILMGIFFVGEILVRPLVKARRLVKR